MIQKMLDDRELTKDKEFDNVDFETVQGFGVEWTRFTQEVVKKEELNRVFCDYFSLFPWGDLSEDAVGADIGCGSGRWASLVAPRVGRLHVVDASLEALKVARNNLSSQENISFHHASVSNMPLDDESLDFAYSLGVLHHVPDIQGALSAVKKKLKPGAPFLLYLYYAFENRPLWFRAVWKISELFQIGISRLPWFPRYWITQAIALFIYWPLARVAFVLDKVGAMPKNWPLSYQRDKSFYTMRTDCLDRFGTRIAYRYSRKEIADLLHVNGFASIRFSEREPYWCVICNCK